MASVPSRDGLRKRIVGRPHPCYRALVNATDWSVFLLATVALNVTPGPDTLYVLARSVAQGRGAGIVSVLGGSTGRLVHTASTALGLSALVAASPGALGVVRYLGAAYLLYLAVRMVATASPRDGAPTPPQPLGAIYRQGLVTNLLNPSVALFFVAFLPQFARAEAGSVGLQLLLLGLVFTASATLWSMTIALLAGGFGDWLARHPQYVRIQRLFAAAVFAALALRLILA
jgi:threonine/homoserine/homoserine lactone efflux protein